MSTCSQIKKSILLTYYHTLFQQSCDSSPSKYIFAVTYKWFLRKRLGKHVGQLIFCWCGHNRNLISLHSFMEEMVGLVEMLGSRFDFEQPGNSKAHCCLISLRVPSMELPPLGSWKEPHTQHQWWTKW